MIGQRSIILAHALCEAPRIQDGVVLEAGWSKVRISSMVLVHLLILREGNMQILLFNYLFGCIRKVTNIWSVLCEI